MRKRLEQNPAGVEQLESSGNDVSFQLSSIIDAPMPFGMIRLRKYIKSIDNSHLEANPLMEATSIWHGDYQTPGGHNQLTIAFQEGERIRDMFQHISRDDRFE